MDLQFSFYRPTSDDGKAVSQLIRACPPLDTNSNYCNLLQCHHFADTSVAVRQADRLVGFISGYLIPMRPDTLFVWQVAVAEQARGHGVAAKMINHILERKACQAVDFIETTITETNSASWALFERIGKSYAAPLSTEALFLSGEHFSEQHESEMLVRIGPLQRVATAGKI